MERLIYIKEELEWEYEEESVHFMASLHHEPCGTARWRKTDKGYKLERFAVLEKCRGNGWVKDGSGFQMCPYFQEFK